jgi:hypothetical protein
MPPCTTKDALQPNSNVQRPRWPADDWWTQDAGQQSPFGVPLAGRHEPNDFPMLNTFPKAFVQPTDDAASLKSTPAMPPTIALGKVFVVSTCGKPG